ncbi:MAG: TraB/GumN family protein [Anaerolineae bacterium]
MNLPFLGSRDKPLRMVWRVEKDGRRSYLVGTAHFFPYSFARSLTGLLRKVETVIFEGPLDEESMDRIASYGRQGDSLPSLADALEPEVIREINRQLGRRLGDQAGSEFYFILEPSRPNYFEMVTRGVRPWMAFFSIWSTCLGWKYSVDMEGFHIAQKLGKRICFLETVEEQLAVLDAIPFERIVRQLNQISHWPVYTGRYVELFLAGDVHGLLSLTDNFASRCRPVVSDRDGLLFQRMKSIFEREDAVAFVGFPHFPGISKLFLEQGYRVSQGVA